ncbi:MAG TPA: 2-oxoacid:acceptor oxidoreductase family protein [Burkholderiaceae bacterium]|nr:2-oxoacid:acceptor oxidoreductase family protein [Burkholderiaceae bacterium]
MFQVRIHGRGGQGVVSCAEMMSIAAFEGGRHAQAFPSFGSERTGAPVVAFCRMDDREIRLREPIMQPDAIIIQDATLLHQVDVFSGLKKDGYILINTTQTFEQLGLGEFVKGFQPDHLLTVPASELAMKHVHRPVPNVPLLGAFAALGGATSRSPGRPKNDCTPSGGLAQPGLGAFISLQAVHAAIAQKFKGAVAQGNQAAATEAYDIVIEQERKAMAHHA